MLRIAITGNIASGKSVVEELLRNKGHKVFDTDIISHEKMNELSTKIITAFKNFEILTNNQIDRNKLGQVVFNNPNKLKLLENILHPAIKEEIEKIFEQNKNEKFIFVSVPLLFESGFDKMFDKIIFISANEDIRLVRLMKRNNLAKEDALKRINSQQNENNKTNKCDFVINNNNSKEELETEITKVLSSIY